MIRNRMRTLIVLTASTLWLLATVAGTASAEGEKIQQGEKIFANRQCTVCHAVHGKG